MVLQPFVNVLVPMFYTWDVSAHGFESTIVKLQSNGSELITTMHNLMVVNNCYFVKCVGSQQLLLCYNVLLASHCYCVQCAGRQQFLVCPILYISGCTDTDCLNAGHHNRPHPLDCL